MTALWAALHTATVWGYLDAATHALGWTGSIGVIAGLIVVAELARIIRALARPAHRPDGDPR